MEVLKSNKGSDKIVHKSFMYAFHYKTKNGIRWRCNKSSRLLCKSNLHINFENFDPEIKNEHNHLSNETEIKVIFIFF